ncbi:RidA family protein [Janibacter sp. GS2]|uniref:RidA family protein n=1 Tax=Janibacter sp. GS2 TaxID=3442646 RepID=UPI003EBA33D3
MVTPPSLPPPPQPQGNYVPTSRAGNLVTTAGMTPRVEGTLAITGRVGDAIDLEEARRGAAIAAANALSAVVDAVGDLDRIVGLVRMTVYVHAASGFTQHTAVADAATDVLVGHLGGLGRCARSAVGVASLPGGAPVEIELTALVA